MQQSYENGYRPRNTETLQQIRESLSELHARGDVEALERAVRALDKQKYKGYRDLLEELGFLCYLSDTTGLLLSDVAPEPIEWRWKGRLAKRKLTLLDGDPGMGKTTLMLKVSADVTQGNPLPGEEGQRAPEGVVLVTLEDGLADTIVPRLARMGADLSRIVSIGFIPPESKDGYERPFSLPGDIPLLEAAITRVKAGLVVIDPIMAIVGNKDVYRDNEVRMALAPLRAIAEKTGVSLCMTRHLTKGGGENALYRGGGSIAFIGLARIGLLVTRDPVDESRCMLASSKNNLGAPAPTLAYRVCNDEEAGDPRAYVQWLGTSQYQARDLLRVGAPPGANRLEIIKLLQGSEEPLSPEDIWQALAEHDPDLEYGNVKMTLSRMRKDGQLISPARGQYILFGKAVTPVTSVTSSSTMAHEADV